MYYIAKEGNESIIYDHSDKTCRISFFPCLYCPDEKIAICPKVVRDDGKQFKVTKLEVYSYRNLQEIRVPQDVYVSGASYVTITRY